ncbi:MULTISPECIES: chromate transporter [Paenibacillus]|uniref:chromate transporter n=1 Tax=Paenibacillus TaxID=44249 RepID=UPI0006D22292|nr:MULTISPECIES: chromate transporter [Paenibacillus]GCL73014.1 chromate transporter [Paenibacillus naphthalenovorans]SDI70115.1 chromate transporter [Paenibacillus naphthalenovorans]
MEWINLFIGFFLANVLGYGGGPASIPLMYQEIVVRHHWATDAQFSNILALGNALPGPIATKIAAFVGYDTVGWLGMTIALAATVVPTAAALILMLRILNKHRQSPVVKGMTLLVQPVIAVMMVILTWQMASTSWQSLGLWQSLAIAAIAYWAMERRKIHPALVIIGAFAYGGLVLPYFI